MLPSIVVVGASAGGVAALRAFTAGFDQPLPVPMIVVLHVGAGRSELPGLLNAAGVSMAKHAEHGERLRPGVIYVAPPDRHVVVTDDHIALTRGPKENWARPAIDPLFRSAAEGFGPAAIGVILTGNLNDGSAGLYEIKSRGGVAIVQDPTDALHPDMPASAAKAVDVDYCVPLADIPALISRLIRTGSTPVTDSPQSPVSTTAPAEGGALDWPVALTCPDCGGALRRSEMGRLVKYDCHIGHSYTAEAMASAQYDDMEKMLRAAERILNERAEFCRQMADRARLSGSDQDAVWQAASGEARDRALALRAFIEQDWISPDRGATLAA